MESDPVVEWLSAKRTGLRIQPPPRALHEADKICHRGGSFFVVQLCGEGSAIGLEDRKETVLGPDGHQDSKHHKPDHKFCAQMTGNGRRKEDDHFEISVNR